MCRRATPPRQRWPLCAGRTPPRSAALEPGQRGGGGAAPGRGGPGGAPPRGSTAITAPGYAEAAMKRAYLMASASEAGATFSVRNAGGTTVASGAIGASLGSWSAGYPNVYAVDFDSVTAAGTYTIAVSGPIAATSPSFAVNTATALYAGALTNALSFYQNERDGPNYIPSALRTAPGHLNDSSAMTYLTP